MGQEQPAEYYDGLFANQGQRPIEKWSWYPVWAQAAQWLEYGDKVLDLGCGPGRFAQAYRRAWPQGGSFIGLDISRTAVDMAMDAMGSDSRFGFAVGSALNLPDGFLDTFDVVTMLEMLEHIEEDLALLTSIPAGKRMILSVPAFDDEGHVRHFNSGDEVLARYRPFFRSGHSIIQLGPWWLMEGERS